MGKEIKFKVIEELGKLGNPDKGGYQKEVNLVSWNNYKPVLDIRKWKYDDSGERVIGKGITISKYEISKLKELIANLTFETMNNL